MAQQIRDVMTPNPITLQATDSAQAAARAMRDGDIGNVIITQGNRVCGIVTDRDIVVRALAEGRDPKTTKLGEICSQDPVTVGPDDSIDDAVNLMREKAIRRLPVVEGGRPVGIVSLGDLAVEHDGERALDDISAAPPNR